MQTQILQTILKKKLIIGIIAGIITISFGMIFYIVNSYGEETTPSNVKHNSLVLPNGASVNVTVNNFLNSIPDNTKNNNTESKDLLQNHNLVLPKLESSYVTNDKQSFMSLPPMIDDNRKAQMLVVRDVTIHDNSANAVTGTNTNIGTGVIQSDMQKQRSPYTLFAGTFISAIMITGLNSDLNGELVASIRNNVYDSVTGKYLLIPQGSRLIGTYNHDLSYQQNRLMVGWNRIIYPNGTSILLHGQPGTDLQGYSGFTGDVDNHYSKIFGASFLMGLIFGGTTVATGNQGTNPYQLSAGATIANQVGAQMSQAGIQVISKGLSIPPTIVISVGYRFNVLTTADLILKPYIYR